MNTGKKNSAAICLCLIFPLTKRVLQYRHSAGGMLEQPATRPMLLVSSASSGGDDVARAAWRQAVDRAQGPATWLELPGSSHLSFTDSELLSPLLPPPGFEPRAGLAKVDHDLRLFFDTYLRGQTQTGDYLLPAVTP